MADLFFVVASFLAALAVGWFFFSPDSAGSDGTEWGEPRSLARPVYVSGYAGRGELRDATLPAGAVVRRVEEHRGGGPGGGNVWLFEALHIDGLPVVWLPSTAWSERWGLQAWLDEGARWCRQFSYERPKTRPIRPSEGS